MTLPEDVANQKSIKTLLRAIARSEGNFSLILACCNYTTLRQSIVQQLREQSSVEIRELVLEQSVKTIYSTIAAKLGQEQPRAVMVFGLESVSALDQVLTATNQVREEFRKFAFPLVVWVTDEVWQKLIRLVPDFEGWATTVEFAIATDELIHFIQQTTDNVFAQVLNTGTSISLDNTTLHLGIGSPLRAELESARRELRDRGVDVDQALEASLEFVLGRDVCSSPDQSRQHYERSLAYWQQSENLLRRGCLLFYLGFWWRTYGLGHRNEYELACERARDYFQQSVEVFQQAHRSDLAAKFINALGDSLQRLERWDELKVVANQALALHLDNLDPFRLARTYGFLAEVALSQSHWSQGRDFAKLAIALLDNAQAETGQPVSAEQSAYLDWELSLHRGWYLFSFAKSYFGLGQVQEAIKTLEAARATTNPQYDPELYIGILNELRSLYFKQRDYLKAFQTKQERRAIEHQYGYCAFIGAGRLQPKQQVTNPALSPFQPQGIVAVEIPASGREQDVDRLVARLCRDDRRLTVIHGQSGVGKSSLLQAGLIPALKQSHKAICTRDVLPVLQQDYTDWIKGLGESLATALVETQHCSSFPGTAASSMHATGATLSCDFANMPDPVTLDSIPAILELLQKNAKNNLLTVLIFDQFEEFFFSHKDPVKRRCFYEFLRECLNVPFVKVILSLREDYISYLLECNNRLASLDIVNNNILDRENLYYLGNFSPDDARVVIQNFTKQAHFYLEPDLIEQLVSDLAAELGEVRPIELQVVGAQLQTETIKTLAQYRKSGTKAELVQRFLEEVITDCGSENEQAARLVLYLLTDESGTRPFKNRTELAGALDEIDESEKLDLVLEILVKSGLIFLRPEAEVPAERYQLVHDYLVTFIRQQNNLLTRLEKQKQELLKKKAEIERLRKRMRLFRAGIAAGIAIAVLATQVEFQRRRAVNSEIRAHADSSAALFASNQPLDALRESLIAGTHLKEAIWGETDASTRAKVLTALQQTLYGTRESNRLEAHRNTVFSLSFSPDGKTLASASADRTVQIWSVDGKLLSTLKGHSDSVFSVSFSPDGQTIASASRDGTVKLWNKNGSLLKTLKGHTKMVLSVSFSPDGQTIASASQDGVIKLWHPDGSEKLSWKGHRDRVSDVSFSPEGKIIASASGDGTIKLWNLDGTLLKTIQAVNIYRIRFSPDGKTIAGAYLDGTIKLWSKNGSLLKTIKRRENLENDENSVLSVSFSPNGKILASASKDGTVKLWNLKGELQMTLKGHEFWVYSVAFSPDGTTLASAGSDRTIRLWNLKGISHQERLSRVSFSQNSQLVASASADGTVKLWQRGGTLIRTLSGHKGGVWSVSISPDGQMLASAGEDKTVKLWRIDGTLLTTLKGHSNSVLSVKFSPDGKIIASASRDKTVKLWSRDGKLVKTLKGHGDLVNAITFSPDSQMLASASDDNTVKLWRIDGTLLKTFKGHKNKVLDVSFSPNGQTLASSSADSTIKLWNLDGTLLDTLKQHTDWVNSISFSRDGKILASGSRDNTVNIWRLEGSAGTLLITLKRHEGAVNGVSFSPDGRTLVSASDDQTIIVWNLGDFKLDTLLNRGCDRIQDYLKTNHLLEDSDRPSCDNILF
ncbi:MAG TPA: WD40 repeat domain-containing protein [Allocoleopsis sp.]